MQSKTRIIKRYAKNIKNLNNFTNNLDETLQNDIYKYLPQITQLTFQEIAGLPTYYITIHTLFMYKQLITDIQQYKQQHNQLKQEINRNIITESINSIEKLTEKYDKPTEYLTFNRFHILQLGEDTI